MSLTRVTPSPQRARTNAKIETYEECEGAIGGFSPQGTATQSKKRIQKFTIDHLCVDVPSDAMLQEMFDFFDPDGTGAIDAQGFKEVFKDCFENYGAPMEDKDVNRLFARLGKGKNDGKIRFDEFCVLILNRLKM